jgi:hypothetical protein
MLRICPLLGLVTLLSLVSGCGTVGKSTEPLNFTTAAGPDTSSGNGRYVLTTDEQALGCKKLTGRIQVRIMQMRGYETREKTTIASRALHSVGKTVFGGTDAGLNTDAQYASDKAVLEAYNRQLVAKDCKSFNIAEALEGAAQPVPTIEAPSKAAAAAQNANLAPSKSP